MTTLTYTYRFELAVAFVLRAEGGYVNDPADAGGATCYGISQRQYPELNIAALTQEQAKAIYHRDYWVKCQCEQFNAPLGCVVFDTAVNMGCRTAIKLLQESLDALSAKPVAIDGVIGPQTLAAVMITDEDALITDLLAGRARRYHNLVVERRSQQRFIFGWLKRLHELHHFILKEAHPWH
ncbi:glycoside hydrolase family 108 protein [Candidatus Sororendozoicomonas aggregata]|uniref:glycoside hydrolase family 108 protein n=1 Tax=Candidatus Sororendozoicomonas aggregata TaxID=3073239 RepID=UPI002ED0896E